jgi:uncharacterized protein DUF1566
MKQKLFYTSGLITLVLLALGAIPAKAQTTANGPYYAWPAWDQTLPSNVRFIVLSNMNNAAVLDRETGLVWERSPATAGLSWSSAVATCVTRRTGNRFGWRLPTVNELASLFDPLATNVPFLPSGHPFNGLPAGSTSFWSVTPGTDAEFEAHHIVGYTLAIAGPFFVLGNVAADTFSLGVWCVRGGLFPGPQ